MNQTSFFEIDQPEDRSLIKVTAKEAFFKESQNFQKKVIKIEKLQKGNEALKFNLEDIRLRLVKVLRPISDRFCDLRVKSLEILDEHAQGTYFRINEKRKIHGLIIEGAAELTGSFHDDRGKQFHDKYSTISFDEQEETFLDGMKTIFKEAFGSFRDEDSHVKSTQPFTKNTRKKKSKAELHEEKIQLESKSMYRGLMKTLHPDFEQDEERKKEKTEVTQKIAIAYKENNVYELLKLRSEYLNESISENELKTYATELNKRIRELELERYRIKFQYQGLYDNFYSTSPDEITRRINKEKEGLEKQIQIERDHAETFADRKKLRRFLKEEIQLAKGGPSDFDDALMDAFFDDCH